MIKGLDEPIEVKVAHFGLLLTFSESIILEMSDSIQKGNLD